MQINNAFYLVKPFIPRLMQIVLRRAMTLWKRPSTGGLWPIDEKSCTPPAWWSGWPGGKQFAFVLTHDVDTAKGHARCELLRKLEEELGVRSSFNFVPERYAVSSKLRDRLTQNGFEVGVHGLCHDGKLFRSRQIFLRRAIKINRYISEWKAVGFRSPAMHHNLDWIYDLEIEYDSSTFDTDPFEPQPTGLRTIFPVMMNGKSSRPGYVELPYTLPQDFTLFILLKERSIDIWKRKVDWIARKHGMVLVITHPDYMKFDARKRTAEEYPVERYTSLIEYVKSEYEGCYWHALPKDVARFCRDSLARFSPGPSPHLKM